MTERKLFRLVHARARAGAIEFIRNAPDGYVVEIKEPTRSLAQNARLHAMLGAVSHQKEWYGQYLSSEDWKRMFCAALEGVRVVPGIEQGTFVPIGMRTRDMTVSELGDLMTLIEKFCAEHGVLLYDDEEVA